MHADFEKLLSKYSSTAGILVTNANCYKTGKTLCESFHVRGYPTLLYGDGDDDLHLKEYNWMDNKFEQMDNFVQSLLGNSSMPEDAFPLMPSKRPMAAETLV